MEDDFRETRPAPAPRQTSTEGKDSRISFAIKSKSQQTLSKPPPDLTSKSKGPQRPISESKDRPPSHHSGGEQYDDRKSQKPQDRRTEDGKRPYRDAPHPKERTADHSDYPPSKKPKHEPKPKLILPPEFASSDSIYYRKPGHESVVGAGTYGRVYKAIHIYTKAKVALKKIKMEGERDGFPITATREIRLLQHLRHKNVVALQEVMVEKNECFMVFEYLSHDLTGLINHPTFKLTAAHKKHLARQMFDGLEFLHRRGVLHRDIKAANILISNDGQLRYADFGLARFYSKSRQLDYTNRVITIWYRPPELLLGETQYGPAVDIWSAACVFVEMFTRKAIFPGEGSELNQLEKVYNVLGTPTRSDWPGIVELPWFELIQPNIDRKKRTFESTFKDILSPATLDLVRSMLRYDPTKRPSAEEVLAHPYFVEEMPKPQQAIELAETEGDWHEYESKAYRKEKERKEKDRRRIEADGQAMVPQQSQPLRGGVDRRQGEHESRKPSSYSTANMLPTPTSLAATTRLGPNKSSHPNASESKGRSHHTAVTRAMPPPNSTSLNPSATTSINSAINLNTDVTSTSGLAPQHPVSPAANHPGSSSDDDNGDAEMDVESPSGSPYAGGDDTMQMTPPPPRDERGDVSPDDDDDGSVRMDMS